MNSTAKKRVSTSISRAAAFLLFLLCITYITGLQAQPLPKDVFINLCEMRNSESLREILKSMSGEERRKWVNGEFGYNPLSEYFYSNSDSLAVDVLLVLLDYQCDPNSEIWLYKCGMVPPLTAAAFLGEEKAVKYLLSYGANVDTYNIYMKVYARASVPPCVVDNTLGWTAQHFAVNGGYAEIVEQLLCSGAAPLKSNQVCGKKVITPFHLALCQGWREVVQVFLNHGVDPNTPLQLANFLFSPLRLCTFYSYNGPQIFELLLSTGKVSNIVEDDLLEYIDKYHSVMAMFLAQEGCVFPEKSRTGFHDESVVRILYCHDYKENPIHEALHCGCIHLSQDSGQSCRGQSPDLNSDCSWDEDVERKRSSSLNNIDVSVFKTCFSRLSVSMPDNERSVPPSITTPYEYMPRKFRNIEELDDFWRVLQKNKAGVNKARTDGCTPLHLAVLYNNCPAVSALIMMNAELSPLDANERTPLQTAFMSQNKAMTDILVPAIRSKVLELNKCCGYSVVDQFTYDMHVSTHVNLAYETEFPVDVLIAVKWPEVLSLQAQAANIVRRAFKTDNALQHFSYVRMPLFYKYFLDFIPERAR